MSLPISKDCFPAPTICYNCHRKSSSRVKKQKNSDPKEEHKRCGGCHLLTYCDKDCQREHWLRVHKSHCRFLSGKVPVKNSQHNAPTCSRCMDQRQASIAEIRSENSPKTCCDIEEIATYMKTAMGTILGFHKEGKKCDCSVVFALNLPFSLGEVSGQYQELSSTGIDAMLAHSLKILVAMIIKARNDEHKNILRNLYVDVIKERSLFWIDILVQGKPSPKLPKQSSNENNYLLDKVNSLNKTIYSASNPWWKILKFSVEFIANTNGFLIGHFRDSHGLEDTRFQHLKQVHDYEESQLRNQAIVCENQMWPNFMLWPQVTNGSLHALAVLLPPGTCCQSCNAQLRVEVAISGDESNWKALSLLLSTVGENGAIMASCPVSINPNCLVNCQSKDAEYQMYKDEVQWKELQSERDSYYIESRDCDFCMKSSLSSHRCSTCLAVQYCSPVCQKNDLVFHRSVCATWAKDESRRILGKVRQKKHWKNVVDKK